MEDKLEQRFSALLHEYQTALKWARDTLKEKEEENRRLKLIILRMSEVAEERKEDANAFDP